MAKKKTVTPVISPEAEKVTPVISPEAEVSTQFLTEEEANMLNTVLSQKSHKNQLFTFIKTLINY